MSDAGLRTIIQIGDGKGNPSLAVISKIAEILRMEVTLHIKKNGY